VVDREQLDLKQKLVRTDDFRWFVPSDGPSASHDEPLRLVGGVDISFVKDNDVDACASLVVLALPRLQVCLMQLRSC
jgi:hypothetical protein